MDAPKIEGPAKSRVIDVEEQVRLTAELIFEHLYRDGEMKLDDLRNAISRHSPFFEWACGWLIGKGDIKIIGDGKSFRIRRNPPTPVVIPLRGNGFVPRSSPDLAVTRRWPDHSVTLLATKCLRKFRHVGGRGNGPYPRVSGCGSVFP